MALPIAGIIYGATAAVDILSRIYNAWREHPDQTMAQNLRAAKLAEVQSKIAEVGLEEKVRGRFADMRSQRLRDLVGMKEGLDTGTISPAELGIEGGGLAARDMPMIRGVAARLGMDPQDLVARFDPTRSNMYVPQSRRGNAPRPSAKQIAAPGAVQDTGPLQLNPVATIGPG